MEKARSTPGDADDYYFLRWDSLEDTFFGNDGVIPPGPYDEPPRTRLTLHRTSCMKNN